MGYKGRLRNTLGLELPGLAQSRLNLRNPRRDSYRKNLFLKANRPTNPGPKSSKVPGTGTGAGLPLKP